MIECYILICNIIVVAFVLTMIHYGVFRKKLPEPVITHVRAITRTAKAFETIPVISPDGSRVAYVISEYGSSDIWVHRIASGKKQKLTKNVKGVNRSPEWSPDGEQIAFVSSRDEGGIYIIPEAGGIARQVTAGNYKDIRRIRWFPNGEKLLFSTDRKFYTVSIKGGEPDSIPLANQNLITILGQP